MGLFLSASGVLSGDGIAVRNAIASYVAATGGTFELRAGSMDDRNIGMISSSEATTTILYPDGFADWDDVSKFLSVELKKPVFSFHIHDSDLWMFVAFKGGEEVAWFNPMPDYWGDVDDDERDRWSGNAQDVAALVPGLAVESIARYFVPWSEDIVTAEQKAYEDDAFAIGVDWQLTDFMRRLGFSYPIDQDGTQTGESFYLKVHRQRPGAGAEPTPTVDPPPRTGPSSKPWWKIW
jgi:hypothetical protein